MNLIAFLNVSKTPKITSSGKAWELEFAGKNGNAWSTAKSWIPVSYSELKNGVLYVADWLVAQKTDIMGLMKAGAVCLNGTFIGLEQVKEACENTLKEECGNAPIKKGFFTVQGSDKHRTFRFKPSKHKTAIGVMVGKNNLVDYVWFGWLTNKGTVSYWQNRYDRFRQVVELPIDREELDSCISAILSDTKSAGLLFAQTSQLCSRCGKVLTTPESLRVGKGPECVKLGY